MMVWNVLPSPLLVSNCAGRKGRRSVEGYSGGAKEKVEEGYSTWYLGNDVSATQKNLIQMSVFQDRRVLRQDFLEEREHSLEDVVLGFDLCVKAQLVTEISEPRSSQDVNLKEEHSVEYLVP